MTATAILPLDRDAPSRARSLVRTALTAWHADAACDDAELVVSELVTNALMHGAGPIEVALARESRHLLVAVHDSDAAHIPVTRHPEHDDPGGRGLSIIAALAARWGCHSDESGKTVWAELHLG